jgi:hypothetical protein
MNTMSSHATDARGLQKDDMKKGPSIEIKFMYTGHLII